MVGKLVPAVKHGNKIYKGRAGSTHDEALPHHVRDDMDKKQQDYEEAGMKTGFVNHRGHFLNHRDAMVYAKEHNLLHDRAKEYAHKTSNLTSDMLKSDDGYAWR